MKQVMLAGLLVFLMIASSLPFVIADYGDIYTNEFSQGDEENFINITNPELTIDEKGFNNSANLYIHNNATYDTLSFDVSADTFNGENPSKVGIDIGNNGRDEYRFDGYAVGQWGNQKEFLDEYYTQRDTWDLFPTPEGYDVYVKLPSRSKVNSVSFDIEHPSIPTTMEARFDRYNTHHFGSSYLYFYSYKYTGGITGSYGYAYGYYWPTNYYTNYQYSYQLNYIYPPYYVKYDYGWYQYEYSSGQPDARTFIRWNLDDPDFKVPPGANIIKYELNYPIYLYHGYAGPYGYNWISNSNYYYSGQKDFGAFALTSYPPTTFNYYNSYYNYNYQQGYSSSISQSAFNTIYFNYIPKNRTTPVSWYRSNERFSNSYQVALYDVNYDLTPLVQEWMSGSLPNYGIQISMFRTPYSTIPHLKSGAYVMYNSNNNYAAARARNHYEFYYGGMMYSPFNTYYTQYNVYKPKLVISYDLASINPWVDVGDDSIVDYQHPGELNQRLTLSGYQGAMNNYLRTHLPDEVDDYGNEWTYVPIRFGGDTAGKIVFNNLSIDYDYTATVHYNPTTETAIRELNALVPSTEEGYTLVPINVTSATDGMINLDNLKMTGTKPNYRPTAMEIPDVETDEGSINSELVPISDYFGDVDQDPTTLQYKIQKNDQPGHVDLYLTQEPSRAGKVYLGIDTSKDENWNGVVTTQVSATDDEGKDVWSNEFKIGVEAVNDHPYVDYDLPEISGTEGIDSILVEYNAPSGRDVATGKVSFLMSADGVPYFNDIEGDRIYLDFELLRPDGTVANVERENEDGYRIYRGDGNELTLYVLPPEYTDDPDNFVVMVGSDPDYSSDESNYELRIYTSDVETDRKGETYFDIPIVIGSVNDPPRISAIPDIVMDEDTSYVGSVEFVNEYLTDIDNDVSELVLDFEPSNSAVHIVLTDEGYVSIELDMDFSGVVPVTLTVTDGETEVTSTFNVRIRAINDPPVVVVSNLYENRVIDDMFFIRGTGDDIEKGLRWVEVGVTKYGEFLYEDDWSEADGAYVWQYLVDIRNLDDGMYTIYIRAYDGRDYSEVQVYNVVVETPKPQPPSDPPVVTIESLLDGLQGGNVGIEGTATDESGYVEFVEYRIDGDLWRKAALTGEEWETVVNTRLLTNTEHNLSVRGYDGKSYSEVVFLKFAVYNEDSDLDGISNEMEQRLLMDPFNSLDGTMDFDEDGFSNAQEIEASTDPFDGNSHPVVDEEGDVISVWALVFIGVAIIVTILILGLFLLNIRLERNIHQWREDLQRRRMERKPKTLLQKIVELAPVYAGGYGMQDMGLALPAQPPMDKPALPPMEEQK